MAIPRSQAVPEASFDVMGIPIMFAREASELDWGNNGDETDDVTYHDGDASVLVTGLSGERILLTHGGILALHDFLGRVIEARGLDTD